MFLLQFLKNNCNKIYGDVFRITSNVNDEKFIKLYYTKINRKFLFQPQCHIWHLI
jgi:hypothetical protein